MGTEPVDKNEVNTSLFGTLEIEGGDTYYVFLKQQRSKNIWYLTEQNVFELERENKNDAIVAVLSAAITGKLEGYGKTYILTRLMDAINTLSYKCINAKQVTTSFFTEGEYNSAESGQYFKFQTYMSGKTYRQLELSYEGLRLSLSEYRTALPVRLPKLAPVQDKKSKAAIVANLGVKTAASLFRSMGDRLDWYKAKHYILIDTKEKFQAMMLDFLLAVQQSADKGQAVMTGIDTETTGLNMIDLSPDNPFRDVIVSIPFSWKDDEAYVICTDMFYFSNVGDDTVYTLFNLLFSRNDDYTGQQINFEYAGHTFNFNRDNILVAGFNAFFDEKAFFTHGVEMFFDEDARILLYNLNTDFAQGSEAQKEHGSFAIYNGLKEQTRRFIGDETLELDELYGSQHKDKYRYLADPELALIYGGADADYTRRITKIARKLLPPELYQQYRKYDMTLLFRTAKASWQGMPVDTPEVLAQGELVKQDLEALKEFIYKYAYVANRKSIGEKADRLRSLLNLDTEVEVEEVAEEEKSFRYPFTPANHKKLLFDVLGYPVIARAKKTGEATLDKNVLSKLMMKQRETPVEIMKEDLPSASDPSTPLIQKSKFNMDAYPLARVFSTYSTLNKEYSSYYKPLAEHDMEGRMFYDFSMARAATRRILSAGQTMKGALKRLVIAPPKKLFVSFDASQIEYRHMASLAYIRIKGMFQALYPDDWETRLAATNIAKICEKMHNEESDYHIETSAQMTGLKQYQIDHETRSIYKKVGFGIPYGLGDRKMCENIFGVVNDENLAKTRQLLADYKAKQSEIIDLIEETRDNAFKPTPISQGLRDYLECGDTHVSLVKNFTGFYRLFILEGLTRQRTGRIRRQAGNCQIQGGAAELFRRMLYNFHIGSVKAGLNKKMQWLMLVHDELDFLVDDDIDVLAVIECLYNNCTLRYKDHIPYYIGINFGRNWEDAKDDAAELPVIMVQRLLKAYHEEGLTIPGDGQQPERLLQLKRQYMCDRVEEELKLVIPSLGAGHKWTDAEVELVDNKFENYAVRAYLLVFVDSAAKKAAKKAKTHVPLRVQLESWQEAREKYGFGVAFTSQRFKDARQELSEMNLEDIMLGDSNDFDLSVDLLENSSEEARMVAETAPWFDEKSMFDYSIPSDELVVDSDADGYSFVNDKAEEQIYTMNDNPTNSYDIYKPVNHMRTKVLNVKEGVFSVLLHGTSYAKDTSTLKQKIAKHFQPGEDTLVLIGATSRKVSNIAGREEDLVWLDKLLCGIEEEEGVNSNA